MNTVATAVFVALLALAPDARAHGGPLLQFKTQDVGAVTDRESARAVIDVVAFCRDAACLGKYLDAHAGNARDALEKGYAELERSPLRENVIAACAGELDPHRTQCIADVLQGLVATADNLEGTCVDELGYARDREHPYTANLRRKSVAASNMGKLLHATCAKDKNAEACYRRTANAMRREARKALPHLRYAVSEMVYFSVQSLLCESGETAVLGPDADGLSPFPGFGKAFCATADRIRPLTGFNPMKVAFAPSPNAIEPPRMCEIRKLNDSASFEMLIRNPIEREAAYLEERRLKDILERHYERKAGQPSLAPGDKTNAE